MLSLTPVEQTTGYFRSAGSTSVIRRAPLERDVFPRPGEGDDEATAYLDQEIDVDRAPEQPAKEAGELEAPEVHHRRPAADGGEIALWR